ncbi:dihydrodipicolinate synthase family protein [Kitasatospora sp. NBC_00240]|uniref:dihydrodipicolinate synthase family protein n=1 Tax=Kitasatospora sp. NBC_00240 TaxID=2903567 RepID=UPI00225992E0|nr:dihydrodipicolinate synthase family protein [Kitasatospora sp. NBC_00240]MCX5213486.1 dihydrodipicolinate synthase family protein [Kitasatospora sp. NBC_00240]
MNQHIPLTGIFVPLVTPFAADGTVARPALEALAHSLLDEGVAGLAALGTTAEAGALDETERRTVVEVVAAVCRERGATLLVGTGGAGTRGAAEALLALGKDTPQAAAAMVTVPAFSRPGEAGVIAHFRRLAEASPVPLVVYHIPYRTGQQLSAAALLELAAVPGIAGVKYAVGGIDQDTVELLGSAPAGFAVLAGDDAFLSPLLALGAAGGILASAHLATTRFVELAAAWQAGEAARARVLGHQLAALAKAAFAGPNPTVIKAALHAQGRIPTPDVRLPLLPAGPVETAVALAGADRLTR